ncbi:DUF4157 domain-containing protein [Streptomyces sp. NPDC088921]|uniref:eCIS core domain-containing protein n=1 Tax=unclassified Streptomyces TaxID=2593676 RepID=UPI003420EF3F
MNETTTAAAGLAGRGQPLEAGVRDQLSAHFAHDFSPVRVHVGPEADAAARGLDATAYTVGNDVVFSRGAYDPLTTRGRALIAHELAHVAQHGGTAHAPNPLAAPGARLPTASAPLERQADLASALAGRPLPGTWVWERATTPFLGRTGTGWVPFTITYAEQDREIAAVERLPEEPGAVRVDLGAFVMPASKGPWLDRYKAVAEQRGLQAVVDVSGQRVKAGLWEKRAPTPELRRLWLQRVQWPAGTAQQWWYEAGGAKPDKGEFQPTTRGGPAQIDHIVELQLGGTNVPDNLAPHDKDDNESSGRAIWKNIREAAEKVTRVLQAHPEDGPVNSITLTFSSAVQPKPHVMGEPLKTLPVAKSDRPAVIEGRRGQAANALQVHFTALADLKANSRPDATEQQEAAAELAARLDYPLTAGPSSHTLRVPTAVTGEDRIEGDTVNDPARELIAGLVLEKLKRTKNHEHDQVTGWLNSEQHPVRSRSRLPIAIKGHGERLLFDVTEVGAKIGRLKLPGGSERIQFTYPYLSAGEMTLQMTDEGLVGRGRLTPSVPLLSRVPIDVTLDRAGLRGSVTAPKDKLSLPPFRITDASLDVSLGTPLSVSGHLGIALGRVATADLKAGADASGLFVRGGVSVQVPGLDEGAGEIEYRPGTALRGHAVATASRSDGLVRGGSVRVDFSGSAWTVSGDVQLMLPGGNPARLTVARHGDRMLYSGRALITVPGLNPVEVALTYDGEHVAGSAATAFTILGMHGDLHLRYHDGRLTGTGVIELKRGKVTGSLKAHLDEQGRISGEGRALVEIKPGLVGAVGVVLSPEHRLRVAGELRFPPYRFLEQRGNRYELFHYNLPDIPLFAIPLGPRSIGLVARIGASMAAQYSFGPGEIRDTVIAAAFNPLEEDSDVEVEAQARLVLPAQAGIELSLRAAAGLSLAVASVTGGITVTGGVTLRGGLEAGVHLRYAKHILAFDAEAAVRVQPVLTLRIEADIVAEASLIGEQRWPYELASYSYATGLEFGMIAPFHYQSDQPLRLPEAKDIRWIVPDIDVSALTDRISGKVRAGLGL